MSLLFPQVFPKAQITVDHLGIEMIPLLPWREEGN